MKLRSLFTALVLALLAGAATSSHAQVGIYLNPFFTHVHIGTADSGPFAFLGDGQTSRWFGGIDYGGYWDFFHRPGFSAGVDVRDTVQHGNNASLNTFSVGARIAGNPIKYGFKPYAEIAVGAGHSKAELSIITTTRAQFDILAGLDYPLGKHLDFRAVEVGYGNVETISSSNVGTGNCTYSVPVAGGSVVENCHTIPSASLIHVSTGLVFRFK